MSRQPAATVTLLLSCPDRPGLVAGIANFIHRRGGNIVHADQHTDAEEGVFFQRVEFQHVDGVIDRDELAAAADGLAGELGMQMRIAYGDERPRIAVLVSRDSHCMYDLFARWKSGA